MRRLWIVLAVMVATLWVLATMPSAREKAKEKEEERRENPIH